MKKLLLGAIIALLPLTSFAATILGFKAGIGNWSQSASGATVSAIGTDILDGAKKDEGYTYFSVEHPVPLVPNFKYATVAVTTAGNTINTVLDLEQTDATFYYEILDNVVSLDLGITTRKVDGLFETAGSSVSFSGTIPMLYASAEVLLPAGFALEAEINTIGSGDKITDIIAKLTYTTDFNLGIEVGTRTQSVDVNLDSVQTNIDFSGFFAGVYFVF